MIDPTSIATTFCSSPWLHLRITYDGTFIPCRWSSFATARNLYPAQNISNTSIAEYYNSESMRDFRLALLSGQGSPLCSTCYYEDSFNKLSGRKKQLFRSNLNTEFVVNWYSSQHSANFEHTANNAGHGDMWPLDLQIDLDTTCNGACIMCFPSTSSRLNADYKKLHVLQPAEFGPPSTAKSWVDNPATLDKFIAELKALPSIQYIHLLGGETLFVESFYTICEALIDAGLAKDIILGTTTNCTIFTDRLIQIIKEFRGFHLGLSIESVNPLNDYIRYPSNIKDTLKVISQFVALREEIPTLLLTMRITPTIFSILYLDEVVEYLILNNVTTESCNILHSPSVLRMELLPDNLRRQAIFKLKAVAERLQLPYNIVSEVDTRDPNKGFRVTSDVTYKYIEFLENYVIPENVEEERYKLVRFLKGFESLRGNSILDYAPEFEEFLTEYGYKR
jgi:MoaA/NifB/PqqE/SkfB family radical SAM enzyme